MDKTLEPYLTEFRTLLRQRMLIEEVRRVSGKEPTKFLEIVKLAQPRMKTLSDIFVVADFFFYPIRMKVEEFLALYKQTAKDFQAYLKTQEEKE